MELIFEPKGETTVISIIGRLDAATSGEADARLSSEVPDDAKALIIDFGKLDYISSAGLRVILMLAKRCQPKGVKLALATMNPNVKEIFDISGFSTIFKIFSNIDEALCFVND